VYSNGTLVFQNIYCVKNKIIVHPKDDVLIHTPVKKVERMQ